ncbi:erythromycin esterase family protein [Nocardia anaemiae]|uniref:erythromycin esterase family protein n=1 Tax=Nocardia anaemiae TaxID=263910 RepID=UPI0007A3EE67|nr:erythromycin esterase family protein [Nocardia anaemiae]
MGTTLASSESDTGTSDLREWLRTQARPIFDTGSNSVGSDIAELNERLGSATVVGLGESTRFSRQTFGLRERVFRVLVAKYGFRALAVQDSARSGERLDAYVRTGTGDPESVLADAWRPTRTAEMAAALGWIREFNKEHPEDPVRIFGVEPPRAEPSDYDVVLDYVRRHAPDRLAAIESHLDPIRTAHQIDEHVQRHQGIHPGRAFVDDARDALNLFEKLPTTTEFENALTHLRLIVEFHEKSVAGQGGFARDERPAADRVIEWQRDTGVKIAYWDGIAHTAALTLGAGPAETSEFRGTGSYLREHFDAGYVSVAIGFHHGDLGMAVAPEPQPELVDAALGTVDLPAFYIDLHSAAPESVRQWLHGPAKLRTISGIYDPAEDATAHTTVRSLADAFDVLVHIRETSPVHWLPQASA